MARAFIITGSNSPEARELLAKALRLADERLGRVTACSQVRRSRAWGFEAADFYNQVLQLDTELEPGELLEAALRTEQLLGRDRSAEKEEKQRTGQRYASRTMDIDILFYDDTVMQTPQLTLPHPQIEHRLFVLEPLAEIAPDMRHPLTGLTVNEMILQLKEQQG